MNGARLANLLGAFALGVNDRQRAAVLANAPDPSFAAALVTLAQEDDLTIRQLSEALRLSHAATVRLVDRLENDKLARRGSGADARSVALRLTAAGRRRVRPLLAARAAALAEILAPLPATQRRALEITLGVLLDRMTTSVPEAYALCRLCDIAVCDQRRCPVECADRRLRA